MHILYADPRLITGAARVPPERRLQRHGPPSAHRQESPQRATGQSAHHLGEVV